MRVESSHWFSLCSLTPTKCNTSRDSCNCLCPRSRRNFPDPSTFQSNVFSVWFWCSRVSSSTAVTDFEINATSVNDSTLQLYDHFVLSWFLYLYVAAPLYGSFHPPFQKSTVAKVSHAQSNSLVPAMAIKYRQYLQELTISKKIPGLCLSVFNPLSLFSSIS